MATTHVVEIQGLDRFYARLGKLRGEPLARTAQKSLTKGLKRTVVPAMRAATPVGSGKKGGNPHLPGNLRKAVDARAARRRSGEIAAVKVGPGGKKGPNSAWYAHFVIRGTKAHMITPGGQAGGSFSALIRRANRGNALALNVAGSLRSVVHHPGARANAFVKAGRGHEQEINKQLIRDLIAASNP